MKKKEKTKVVKIFLESLLVNEGMYFGKKYWDGEDSQREREDQRWEAKQSGFRKSFSKAIGKVSKRRKAQRNK